MTLKKKKHLNFLFQYGYVNMCKKTHIKQFHWVFKPSQQFSYHVKKKLIHTNKYTKKNKHPN